MAELDQPPKTFPFFRLPRELRERIYSLSLREDGITVRRLGGVQTRPNRHSWSSPVNIQFYSELSLLLVSRQFSKGYTEETDRSMELKFFEWFDESCPIWKERIKPYILSSFPSEALGALAPRLRHFCLEVTLDPPDYQPCYYFTETFAAKTRECALSAIAIFPAMQTLKLTVKLNGRMARIRWGKEHEGGLQRAIESGFKCHDLFTMAIPFHGRVTRAFHFVDHFLLDDCDSSLYVDERNTITFDLIPSQGPYTLGGCEWTVIDGGATSIEELEARHLGWVAEW